MIRNPKYSRDSVTGKRITVSNAAGQIVFEGVIMTTSGPSEGTFNCSLIPHRETDFIRRHGFRVVTVEEPWFNRLDHAESDDSFKLHLRDSAEEREFFRAR